jgi:acetyl-CoA/propionyl-CoA carboxylase biotin carboxyl carrier protein
MLGLPVGLLDGVSSATTGRNDAAAEVSRTVDSNALVAPIAGTVLVWKVEDGASVSAGESVSVMEAMKMESAIEAHRSGRLSQKVAAGTYVPAGTVIAEITSGD